MRKRSPPSVLFAFLLVIGLILTGLSRVSLAQSFPGAWRTFSQFDGAIGSWFFDTAESANGVLWFGTDRGVLRYDGVWYSYDQTETLPLGSVQSLLIDKQGVLWATTSRGIARLNGEQWVVEGESQGLAAGSYRALIELGNGDLWAGSAAGLYARPQGSQTWQKLADSPAAAVSMLAIDAAGDVWLADGPDLYRRRAGSWQSVPLPYAGKALGVSIRALAPSGRGGMWVGTDGEGVAYVKENAVVWYRAASAVAGPPGDKILALHETKQGDLWVGTNGNGLGHWRNGEWEEIGIADGLAADYITSIFEDKDGLLWFGTVAGLSRYDARSWQIWGADEGAPVSPVNTLARDRDGHLWAGVNGEGIFHFDGKVWTTPPPGFASSSIPSYITSSFVDADGALWFGTDGDGVLYFHSGVITRLTSKDGLTGDTVSAIAQTPDKAMWFGARQQGLDRWDGQNWRHFTSADGLASDDVRALFVDDKGQLWVGSSGGLVMYDGANWRAGAVGKEISDKSLTDVRAIAQSRDGSLWFATWSSGISRLHDGVWSTYTSASGLLAPGAAAIWADPQSDRVWFGTVGGLSVFDGQTWQNFSSSTGLGIGRVYALQSGPGAGVYVGGDTGVALFTPDTTPPRVEVVSVNGLAPQNQRVTVSPVETIRINFEGRDLLSPESDLGYRYRLLGYDADWRQTRVPRATYPAQVEGVYRFEVEARDTGLNYSPLQVVDIEVRRPPPTIYIPSFGEVRTEYALIAVTILTLLGVLGVYAVWSTFEQLAMRRLAVERRFNPYVAGSPIRDDAMFFGRAKLLDEIESSLHQNSLMIHGERRIGKTSLLYQIQQRLLKKSDPEYHFLPIYIDLEGAPENEFFHRLMEGIVETVQEPLATMPQRQELHYFQQKPTEPYGDRDFRRDLRTIIDHLKTYFHLQPRLIFLLDEADIMNTYNNLTQQQLRRILQDTFAHNVGVVVAGVNISKSWDRVESPWYNMFVEIAMEPFSRQEAEKLMTEPVTRFYRWDEDAMAYVYQQSQGRPHRIQQISMEAVNNMLDHKRRHITLEDVKVGYERILFAEGH